MKAQFLIFCFLAIIISLTFSDCKEPSPTIVKGKVVDFYTNEPLQGVAIFIMKWHKADEQYQLFTILSSDANGNFEFIEEDNLDFYIGEMRKNGYLPKQNTIDDYTGKFIKNNVTDVIIPLIPKDSWVNVQVDKTTPGKSKIFLQVYSPILEQEIGISRGKVSLNHSELELTEGQTLAQYLPIASNEMITIYWDFSPIVTGTAFKDSIFVTRGDTSTIIINY